MLLHPAQDHHLAVCGRDLVLLDGAKGEYGLMAGLGEGVVRTGPAFAVADQRVAEMLVQAGLLSPEPRLGEALPPDPARSALEADVEADRPRFLALVLEATCDGVLGYHGRPFARLLLEARRARLSLPVHARCDAALLSHAAAFDAASPWFGWPGACLYRCFVLLRQLRRRGYAPLWVFAVRTWPFSAHCWLQAGEVALTDHADTLRGYTPILAV